MRGPTAFPKPKKSIPIDGLLWQLWFAIPGVPAPYRRKGYVHVVWRDNARQVRHYLAPEEAETVFVKQAGPNGQRFAVPRNHIGMGYDRHGFPTGVWVGNDPVLIPMDPGLKRGEITAEDVSEIIDRAIIIRSEIGSDWLSRNKGWLAVGFMTFVGIGIMILLGGAGVQSVVRPGP
jgi:hypothetical protein